MMGTTFVRLSTAIDSVDIEQEQLLPNVHL
jgi:hypothetical protein